MKLTRIFGLFMLCIALGAYADVSSALKEADRLHEEERYEQAISLLNNTLSGALGAKEKAELYWRLSRETLYLGEILADQNAAKSKILATFEEGERYADRAIEADATNYNAQYWKASNIGKWGTTKGILDSLFKAKPMRDILIKVITLKEAHPDAYYVLGQLYEKVPGGIISFGDKDLAVSFGRLSVALHEQELAAGIEDKKSYDFYTQLASHLAARNWSAAKRNGEQAKKNSKYQSAKNPFDRGSYYEGSLTLKNISDVEEARQILNGVIRELESIGRRTGSQEQDLNKAKELLATLKP
jgi:tetratricopeptide (TPR) repeat protein